MLYTLFDMDVFAPPVPNSELLFGDLLDTARFSLILNYSHTDPFFLRRIDPNGGGDGGAEDLGYDGRVPASSALPGMGSITHNDSSSATSQPKLLSSILY